MIGLIFTDINNMKIILILLRINMFLNNERIYIKIGDNLKKYIWSWGHTNE